MAEREAAGLSQEERVELRDNFRSDLPMPLTPLVGRVDEVAAVAGLVRNDEIRLVTLTGPGGVGKTRLALQIGTELREEFGGAVWFVPLDPIRDPGLVVATISQVLGLREVSGRPLTERLIAFLRSRPSLLILDNFEHLLDAAADVSRLLIACPGLKVLITSRVMLRLSGEQVFPVPPLAYPGAADLSPGAEAGEFDAVRLFVVRARSANPSFVTPPAHVATIGTICARLEGLPLAIELAAARISHLSLPALADRLDRILPLLTAGARDAPTRQRTMRDAIAWSHALLDAGEQRLLRRLAVFRGGFTLEAAEAMASGFGDTGDETLDQLSSLVDKNLVRYDDGEQPRYRMLETVREFALERLEASGEAGDARAAHAAWVLQLVQPASPYPHPRGQRAALLRIDHDLPNTRAALSWLLEADPRAATRLAASLGFVWWLRSLLREGAQWTDQVLARDRALSPDRVFVLTAGGVIRAAMAEHAAARALLAEGIELATALGDQVLLAWATYLSGLAASYAGDVATSVRCYEEVLTATRPDGNAFLIGQASLALGYAAYDAGQREEARARTSEALAVLEQIGEEYSVSGAHATLGWLALDEGARGDATRHAATALASAVAFEDPRLIGDALALAAGVAGATQDPHGTASLLGAAGAVHASAGSATFLLTRQHADLVARVRVMLGEDAFSAAMAAGSQLGLVDAVEAAWVVIRSASTVLPASEGTSTLGLSPREREVLRLLVMGKTDREIGEALFISPRTASRHVGTLLAKLGVASRTEAAARAVREQLA